jgi:signal transduction histidine kinase
MASDAERRSIERDLHQGVQQLLTALAADLELATRSMDGDPAATKRILAEIGGDVRQALEETRRLAHRIYPPLLEAGGLVVALRSAAASARVPTRIDVPAGTTCPPAIAGTVYFCCLEVLERAASGTPVTISVRNEEGAVAFDVVAELDVDAVLLPLRDRVEAVGGHVTIEPRSGGRVGVAGRLPLSG